jgi:hypothetical protein
MKTSYIPVLITALMLPLTVLLKAESPPLAVTSEIMAQGIDNDEHFALVVIHFRHFDELHVVRRPLSDKAVETKIEKIGLSKATFEKAPLFSTVGLRSMSVKGAKWDAGFICEIEIELTDGRFAIVPIEWTGEAKLKVAEVAKWKIESQ